MEVFMALWHDHWNQDTEGWHGLTGEFASIKRYLLLESIRLDLPLNVEVCLPPRILAGKHPRPQTLPSAHR